MSTFLIVLLALFGYSVFAYADEPNETLQYSCDVTKKLFKLHYQVYWNEPAPRGNDFLSEAGKRAFSCKLDNMLIQGNLALYSQSAQGMCGGLPGGQIERLKLDRMVILNRMPINSCYSSWLDYVSIQSKRDTIEITFCGSHYRKDLGERPGCFTEQFSKSSLPRHLYRGGNFPFEKFQPNTAYMDSPRKQGN